MLGNSVSDVISKAMDRLEVAGTPHSLRHWFASSLRSADVDTLVIKELMGHESLASTAIYTLVPMTQRSRAVALLPGRMPQETQIEDKWAVDNQLDLFKMSEC